MNKPSYWLLPLALSLTLAACSQGGEKMQLPPTPTVEAPTPEDAPAAKPAPAKALKLERVDSLHGSGTTEPLRESRVASGAMGRVQEIKVKEGELVKKGQVLLTLDVRAARLQASQAGSNAAAARVQAAQLKREVERMEPLVQQGVVPQAQLDQLISQQKAASYSAKAAQGSQSLASKGVQDGKILAPFDGRVVEIPVEVGEMVTPSPSAVVRVADLSRLKVRVLLHERSLPRLRVGQPVVARFPSVDHTARGEVTFIAYEVDSATRNVEVTAEVDNPKGLLRPGMFVEVDIEPAAWSDASSARPGSDTTQQQ